MLTKQQTIAGFTKHLSYTYNRDGSVASVAYPSGRTVTYAYNNAQQPVSAIDSANAINFVTSATYAAHGMLASAVNGQATGWNAITRTFSYNNRLQTTRIQAVSPVPQTLVDLAYTYQSAWNDGNVLQVNNNRDSSRSVQYSFDQLNRVISASTYLSNLWGDSFVYDNWNNLLQKVVTKGTAEGFSVAVNNKNQMVGYAYDLAGNLTQDGLDSLTFDAENRVITANTVSYAYDGNNIRVSKSNGTLYWADDNAQTLSTSDLSGNVNRDYIYFNSRLVASVANGGANYYLADRLGSTAVVASGDGRSIVWEADYYPFGGLRIITNAFDNHYTFTGYEYDNDTSNYYAVARYQSPRSGRFYSVDRAAADLANPQSWNPYAYALNSPTNLVDPLGMFLFVASGGPGDSGSCNYTVCVTAWAPFPTDPYGGSNTGCSVSVNGICMDNPFGYGPQGTAGGNAGRNGAVKNQTVNNKKPCSEQSTVGQRVTTGVQGALNVGLGELKTLGFGTLGVAGVAGAPETGGVSLFATAAAGYGIVSSQGQVTSGLGQLYTAFSGDVSAGKGIQQVGDIMAGPMVGVSTLVITGSATTAQKFANYESLFTAGTGLVNSKTVSEAIQGTVDFGLSVFGLASDEGCQ